MRYRYVEENMEKYRRALVMLVLAVFAAALMACGSSESAGTARSDSSAKFTENRADTTTDVVLLMDESGSMVHADGNRIAIEGAKLFIDMERVSSNVNVALVEFSNRISSTGLVNMGEAQNRADMKSVLDGIAYSGSAHTDTGAALLKAEEILSETPEENEKIMILFTDGRTDIDAGTPGRTTEDSRRDVDLAVQQAQERGYTIYCIGLNADGSVDEGELAKIALSTSGNYHIAADVNELPEFFNSIFAEINSADPVALDEYDADGDYRDVQFSIDSENVMEANVVILSGTQVEDVQIVSPAGESLDLQNDSRVVFTSSRTYSLVKLLYPEMGTWTVRVKGLPGDHIKVGLIYNYDVELTVYISETALVKDEYFYVSAYLSTEGEQIFESPLYGSLSGYVSIVNAESGEETRQDLEAGNSDLHAYCYMEEYGTYYVSVHIEGNGFFRDSEAFAVEVSGEPAGLSREIGKIRVLIGETKELDLDEYYDAAGEEKIVYSVESGSSIFKAEVDGSVLTVAGVEKGTGSLSITADNGSSVSSRYEVEVICESALEAALRLVLPIAAILLVLAAAFVVVRSREKLMGMWYDISISDYQRDEAGNLVCQTYRILNPVALSSVGKRAFSGDRLVKLLYGYYMSTEFNTDKKNAFSSCVDSIMPEARGLRIYGSRKNYTLRLKKSSKNILLVDNNIPSEAQTKEISLENVGYGIAMQERQLGIRFQKAGDAGYVQLNATYKKM
jgi:Ca-activated chloride channel family protein